MTLDLTHILATASFADPEARAECERRISERITALEAREAALVKALADLLKSLSDSDDEGLMEHAEPVRVARSLISAQEVK